jgi:predicted MFS family arabinose efflux permease
LSGSTVALIGPLLGGVLYQLGRTIPFLVDAVSYGASVLGLLFIRTHFQEERLSPDRTLRQDIVEGVRWLTQQRLLRIMWGLNASMSFVGGGFTLLLILIARQESASAAAIGTMFSFLGLGGIIGALIAPWVQRHFRFDQIIISTGWIVVGIFLLLVIAPNPVVLGLIAGANFILMPSCGAALQAYQVALIPDELQGRVNSAFMLVAYSANPVGSFLTGLSFQIVGSTWTILALALALACLATVETLSVDVRDAPPIASMSSL